MLAPSTITQPSYFAGGKADGLFPIYQLTEEQSARSLPGLVGFVGLDGVGHWVQHEAAEQVNRELITFAQVRPRRLSGFQAMTRPREPPLTSSEKGYLFPQSSISRRVLLIGGTVGAKLMLGQLAKASASAGSLERPSILDARIFGLTRWPGTSFVIKANRL